MGRRRWTLILPLAGLMLAGCANSPWSPWWAKHEEPSKSVPAPVATHAAPTASPPTSAADEKTVQQMMAELHQLGAVDPAAEEKLMADLLQTDRSLWPLVLQQFRAAAAYRRQLDERELAQRAGATQQDHFSASTATDRSARQPDASSTTAAREPQSMAGSAAPAPLPAPSIATAVPVATAAAAATTTPTAAATPPQMLPATAPNPQALANSKPAAGDHVSPPKGEVVPATYLAPTGSAPPGSSPKPGGGIGVDWQAQLATAIQAIEAQTKDPSKSDHDLALEARLRMLYLLAGRRDDAMRPLSAAPPAAQDYWSKQIFGLATWLDTERNPDATRRAAETKRILSEALGRLGETAPLVVRNLAFCTSVQSYGSIEPFKKAEFAPEQPVLLYAEVENFSSVPTAKGFRTSLKIDYQIFDSRGQRIADHEFTPIEEVCQNVRRDFFVRFQLNLPKRIYPGHHTLQLTVEDTASHKVGQSTIDFAVKGEE